MTRPDNSLDLLPLSVENDSSRQQSGPFDIIPLLNESFSGAQVFIWILVFKF